VAHEALNRLQEERQMRLWKWFLAFFHLSSAAVCEMSVGKGLADFHDYCDSYENAPMHFHVYECARCGKEFII
jgi:hypothetical protein